MCGIVAWVGGPASEERLGASMARLTPRGPDRGAVWVSDSREVALGHRRLAINDLSERGDQPMESAGVRLVCNGEIYNAPALRARLEGLGYAFRSSSDNEVVLVGYLAWGPDVVAMLEGIFAFVIWDENEQHLVAARDGVGVKPLYHMALGDGIVLASDAGALLPFLDRRPDVDPLALAYVLSIGYVPAPLAIWRGIEKLEPGHLLEVRPGRPPMKRPFWRPPRELRPGRARDDDAAAFAECFEAVVRDQLLSDVPIGLFLSGGLDSTAIALAVRRMGRDVEALTLGFPGGKSDELPVARASARHLGLRHRELSLASADVIDLLHTTVGAFDEPQGYGGPLPLMRISEAASGTHRCVLAGDGGDEVLGGYAWYGKLGGAAGGWRGWRRRLRRRAGTALGGAAALRGAMNEFRCASVLHRHAWRQFPRFLPEEVVHLLAPTGVDFDDDAMLAPMRAHFDEQLPLRRALQRVDLMTFCSGSVLAKVDRASMAFGLEVRVPFLDRRLVEFGMTAPVSRGEETQSKPLLRGYLRGAVPGEVLSSPKQGFSLQANQGLDWEHVRERIASGPLAREGYLAESWSDFVDVATPQREGRLWALLFLTCWLERWTSVESEAAHPARVAGVVH